MKKIIVLVGLIGLVVLVSMRFRATGGVGQRGVSERQVDKRVASVDPRDAEIERLRRRAIEAETDVGQLLAAVKQGSAGLAHVTRSTDSISRAEAFRRLGVGVELAMAGRHAEAFEVYRTLFEAKSDDTTTASKSRILGRMQELGNVYAPARESLQQWQSRALAEAMQSSADKRVAIDAVLLNKALGDGNATIALYNALPDGDPRRQGVAIVGFEEFVQARHYHAVVEAKPLGAMLSELDAGMARAGCGPAELRSHVVGMVARDIEALVGTGRTADAELIRNRLLAIDKSPETLAVIETHMQRGRRAPGG